jgi:hypothetical protein
MEVDNLLDWVKQHKISIVIGLGLFCFVISLAIFNRELPGTDIILYIPIPKDSKTVSKNIVLTTKYNPYRISIFFKKSYKAKDSNVHFLPIHFTLSKNGNILVKETRKSIAGGNGGKDLKPSTYWTYHNYGLFNVPDDGSYEFKIRTESYPLDLLDFDVILSRNASTLWYNLFWIIGVAILIFVILKWGRTKVTFQ